MMNLLNASIDAGTALKAFAVAAGLGGAVAILRSDIEDLRENKVSVERMAVVETKLDAQQQQLTRIERNTEIIREELKQKADKP